MHAIALWTREKTVMGVENFVQLCGHVFFMVSPKCTPATQNALPQYTGSMHANITRACHVVYSTTTA